MLAGITTHTELRQKKAMALSASWVTPEAKFF